MPLIAGAVGASLAWILGPDKGTRDLYVVTAQVIPVLLLALALEARVFRAVGTSPPRLESDELDVEVHDILERLDSMQRTVEDRARNISRFEHEMAARESEARVLEQRAQELARESSAAEDVLRDADRLRTEIALSKAQLADHRSDVRQWIIDIENNRVLVKGAEKRIRRLERSWRWLHLSARGSRAAHVALGVAVLAAGEFEALGRIAEGTSSGEPRFAFAAIGYGFAAVLVAALTKR